MITAGDALRADGAGHHGRAPAAQPAHSQRAAVRGRAARVGCRPRVEQPVAVDSRFTELLIDAEERPELRRDLEQVRSEAIRAGKIVRTCSRSCAVHPRNARLPRSTTSSRPRSRCDVRFGSANIRLLESYGEGLPCVVVDPEEIQQVILDLILNAEQAMRTAHRGGTLTVTTACDDGMVTIQIRMMVPAYRRRWPAGCSSRSSRPRKSAKAPGLVCPSPWGLPRPTRHADARADRPRRLLPSGAPGVDVNDVFPRRAS